MACCKNVRLAQQVLACPCGFSEGPICNTATAKARYACANCAGQVTGCLTAESDPVCTHVVNVVLYKTVNPTCVLRGDEVVYTIAIRNCSTLTIDEVVVTDPALAQWFDIGTIRVNGTVVTGDPEAGIPVPDIVPGGTAVVSIEATLLEDAPDVINNTAYADFDFSTVCGGRDAARSASNQAELRVVEPELTIEKTADRCYITPEDPTLTYTVVVTNTGNCGTSGVVVTDELPDRLAYVAGTTRVNGDDPVNRDPANGINVGSLDPDEYATIQFDAELVCED